MVNPVAKSRKASPSERASLKWEQSREVGSDLDSEVAGAIKARSIRNLTAKNARCMGATRSATRVERFI